MIMMMMTMLMLVVLVEMLVVVSTLLGQCSRYHDYYSNMRVT